MLGSPIHFQVLIECGSANSFDLSPNHPFRQATGSTGGQDHLHNDVENEIHDAMTETVQAEENLDGMFFILCVSLFCEE